ncbi:hypothetical protein KIN20_005913 [Parelaphostrongylus tenuis]|uniref:Uncharacterized protein n=1 Tax=Parelaphostrongylus tenuis TaxID=148309 RepID=A0AAD5M400_PARTN|nr:hypothetical protein KIN20_005913 [Parelaphostrongylus tenuis]
MGYRKVMSSQTPHAMTDDDHTARVSSRFCGIGCGMLFRELFDCEQKINADVCREHLRKLTAEYETSV